ncbi:MAG: porin [Rhodospirillales bacterium]
MAGKAQSPAPAPPPNAGPTAILVPDAGLRGLSLSGLLDGYYSFGFNHPGSGLNQLRNFDVRANQFGLNMGKLTAEYARGPFATRFDVGGGRAFDIMNGSDTAPRFLRNVEQAFASFTPPRARGFKLDFGKFVTSAGAEVIETNENWNYSRSLLFSLGIPYYHFGLRTAMPLTKHFSAGLQVANGWNNVDDNNSGKTIGFTGTVTVDRVTWTHNYYFGPEKADTNQGFRHLYDTTVLVAVNRITSFYINYDYGLDRRLEGGSDHWMGIAGAARFIVTPKIALSPRLEWFNDADGFSTGTAQRIKEVTLTGEYLFIPGVIGRLEYRRDWSNVPFFQRGSVPDAAKSQTTLLGGLILSFAQRR